MPPADLESQILGSLDKLPALPGVAVRLMELALSEEASIQRIAEVIETDPSIAARVLQVANSPMYGRPNRVSSIRRAIVVLGLNPLRELVLAVAVLQSLKGVKGGAGRKWIFPNADFWRHSLAVALCARAICEKIRFPEPDRGFLAGLLHDVGLIVLNLQMGERYGAFYEEYLKNGEVPLDKFERDRLGIDHARVGKILLSNWQFPEQLCRSIENHHSVELDDKTDPETVQLAHILCLANNFASHQGFTVDRMLDPPELEAESMQALSLKPEDLNRVGHGLVQAVNRMASVLEVEVPDLSEYVAWLQEANSALSERTLELEMEVKRLSIFNEISRKFCSSLDLSTAIQGSAETLGFALAMDAMCVTLCDRNPATVNVCLTQPLSKQGLQHIIRHSLREAASVTGQNMDPSKMRLVVSNRPLLQEDPTGREEIAYLDVPLENREKRVGLVTLASGGGEEYAEREVELVQTFAGLLGMSAELIQLHGALNEKSFLDNQTGVLSRNAFLHTLEREFCRASRLTDGLCLMILSLDGADTIQAEYGREALERVFKLVSELLRRCLRGYDVIGRLRETEFGIVLSSLDSEKAEEIGKKTIDEVLALPIDGPGGELAGLSASLGGTAYPHSDVNTARDMLRLAGEALASARNAGGMRAWFSAEAAPQVADGSVHEFMSGSDS